MKNKKLSNLLDVLIIIWMNFCVIVFGIWISAIPITKSKSFYMSHFEKNKSAQIYLKSASMFPDSDPLEIMEKVADITIDYYFGNAKEYQVEINGEKLFNEDEVRHMKDVKELYIKGQIIAVICFMTMIGCIFYLARHFRRIKKKLVITTISFYGVIVLLVIGMFVWGYVSYKTAPEEERALNDYFIYLFINFHHLLFPDPDKFNLATGQNGYDIYTLTKILNSKLFMDAGIIIFVTTLVVILLWFTVIIIYCKNYEKIAKKVDEIHERARNSQMS